MENLEQSCEQLTPPQSDSDEDYGAKKPSKFFKKRGKKASAELAFSPNEDSADLKPAKPQKKARVTKVKKAAIVEAPNMVKTQNRLIGAIQNTDIYQEDDEVMLQDSSADKLSHGGD
jgi:hypothetical protein